MTPLESTAAARSASKGQSPRSGLERRRHARVADSFPVLVEPRRGLFAGPVRGAARDYDAAGACLRCPKPLRVGTPVAVTVHLPRSISDFFRGLKCVLPARVVAIRKTSNAALHDVIVKWDRPLPQLVRGFIGSYQRRIGSLLGATMLAIVYFKWKSLDYFWYSPFFQLYSLTLLTYLVSRFFISWMHRPPKAKGLTPSVSIVISVRNEEKYISQTIDSCYLADYPEGQREVIVVDDGSKDRTPQVIEEMRRKYPQLVSKKLPPSGKRTAMAAGVRLAKGEIVVFVDSDTFLYPDALRHIVCGFEDPSLGASAGYTGVANADTNALTALQDVRYFVSYRLLKASESLFSVVTCCPGCLSAYRRSYLLEILDDWLNQKFLGRPATFGDDRSLTNFILRKHRVIYNDRAVATTLVPETWTHFLRQQVRWKKSWLRETLIASRFMYRKHPVGAIGFYASAFFSLFSPALFFRIMYLEATGQQSQFLYYLLGLVLIALLQSLYFLYKRPSSHWVYGMLWMATSLLIMGPQTYYAVLTVRKNHWGTR